MRSRRYLVGLGMSAGSLLDLRPVPPSVLHFAICKMLEIRQHKASEKVHQVKALTASPAVGI